MLISAVYLIPISDPLGTSEPRGTAWIGYGVIMTDQPPSPPSAADIPDKLAGKPVFAPYSPPAGGWGALRATANALREQSVELKGSRALLSMNQPDGFDCPGCD